MDPNTAPHCIVHFQPLYITRINYPKNQDILSHYTSNKDIL
jgi:hypothetical protein